MAEPFFLTPGETVLLGLCLEEYVILRTEIRENWPFHACLKQRVDPFIPDLRYTRGGRIDPTSVPKDVKWIKGEGEECGTSAQYPNTVFVRNERGVFRQHTDMSRRNLVVLLLLYLDDAVGLSPPYREFIEGQGHIGIAWNELHEKYQRAMQDAGDNSMILTGPQTTQVGSSGSSWSLQASTKLKAFCRWDGTSDGLWEEFACSNGNGPCKWLSR